MPGDRPISNTHRPLDRQLGNTTGPVSRSLHGWSFRKDREPGVQASWARARKMALPYSASELLHIVNRTTTTSSTSNEKEDGKGTVSEQYNSLQSSHQRALVDSLLEAVKAEERNQNAEWTLACIEQDVSEYIRRDCGKVREVREMRVVLKRGPRRNDLGSTPQHDRISNLKDFLPLSEGWVMSTPGHPLPDLLPQSLGSRSQLQLPPSIHSEDAHTDGGSYDPMGAGAPTGDGVPGVIVDLLNGQGLGPHQETQPFHRPPAWMGRGAAPVDEVLAGRALRGPGESDPTSYAPFSGDRAPTPLPVIPDSDSGYLADVE
ncbi:hypothetical protein BFW01_g8080 [Lasiodiplodia theobromae]|nr:hypothetical protein BFW01_g8080 [Lasiodiplodia theobromae]